jgi:hypothetical protein
MVMRRLTQALCLPAIASLLIVSGGGALRASQTQTPAPSAAAAKPRLAGRWQLNKELSAAADSASSPANGSGSGNSYGGGRGGGRGGGFGRGGGGGGGMGGGMGRGGGGMRGGGGGGQGGGNGQADEEKMKQRRALMQEVMEVDATFTIIEGDGSVSFTHTDGRVVTYKTDGKKEKHQLTNGTIETKTRFDKDTDALVIEMDLGDGMKMTHTFTVTGDPRVLADSVKMEGGRMQHASTPRHHIYDDVTSTS